MERQIPHPGVLAAANAVFNSCVAAMPGFQICDVCVVLVGDEYLESITVNVGECELGTRVGFFASTDRSRSLGPLRKIQAGQFTYLGTISILTVLADGKNPSIGR